MSVHITTCRFESNGRMGTQVWSNHVKWMQTYKTAKGTTASNAYLSHLVPSDAHTSKHYLYIANFWYLLRYIG